MSIIKYNNPCQFTILVSLKHYFCYNSWFRNIKFFKLIKICHRTINIQRRTPLIPKKERQVQQTLRLLTSIIFTIPTNLTNLPLHHLLDTHIHKRLQLRYISGAFTHWISIKWKSLWVSDLLDISTHILSRCYILWFHVVSRLLSSLPFFYAH